jgi:hypothetical protein
MRAKIKARRQAQREQLQSGQPVQKQTPTDSEPKKTVPKEYAQTVVSLSPAYPPYSDTEEEDHDSAVEQLDQMEHKMRDVFGNMARISCMENIRCHVEYDECLANLPQTTKEAYVTADSGADKTVLGKEWLVLARIQLER